MRRLTAFCFLLTSASCFAHAAASQVARDSVRADSLGEVTVTAARVALSTHIVAHFPALEIFQHIGPPRLGVPGK